ncbi:MAG: hypothetical protein ACRD4Q_11005 [Candidatus Acidiferrales bacterium]
MKKMTIAVFLGSLLLTVVAAAASAAGTVNITIVPQPEIPLEISDVQVAATPAGVERLTYNLTDMSSQRLLAVEISWKFQLANGRTMNTRARADYLFSADGKLVPHATDPHAIGMLQHQGNTVPVDQITGEITFAQFADGSALGPDPGPMRLWLTSERQGQMQALQQLLSVYKTQGESGLKNAIKTDSLSDTVAEHGLKMLLSSLEQKQGFPAVVARLKEGAATQPPN